MKKRLFFTSILLLNFVFTKSQSRFNSNKLEIGFGLGTNSIVLNIFDTITNQQTHLARNKISPTIFPRLAYTKTFIRTSKLKFDMSIFTGYYKFGGVSRIKPNGYQDKFNFHSLEIGLIPNIILGNRFEIGIGIKGQYSFKMNQKYLGHSGNINNDTAKWRTSSELNNWFETLSSNLGFSLKYHYKKYTLGLEAWKGISNLNKIYPTSMKPDIHENNYRFIIMYNFLKINRKENQKNIP